MVEVRAEGFEQLVDAVGHAHARLDRARASSQRADVGAHGFGLVCAVVVVRRYVATLGRELQGDGAADAARGTRDERDLSGQWA